jgi:hypothetical protein
MCQAQEPRQDKKRTVTSQGVKAPIRTNVPRLMCYFATEQNSKSERYNIAVPSTATFWAKTTSRFTPG